MEQIISESERADFDGLWKDAIKRFLPQLIMRTLPDLYNDVDFSQEPEFLSQELRDTIQRPIADSHNPPLFVDELIKLFMKNGSIEWVLFHIEIQGSGGEDISFRMHLYYCLIFSHHRRMPVGLAILTRPRPKGEKTGIFAAEQYGTRISYKYNCFEVYNLDDEELLNSDNPFDLMFYAVKKTANVREESKFAQLLTLTRLLALKGWNEEDRRDIFNFIVRAVNLKDVALRQKFTRVIKEGDGNTMTLSFVEEYFLNQGIAVGEARGEKRGESRGRREANLETARRLRAMGLSDSDISKATDLPIEEIEEFAKL